MARISRFLNVLVVKLVYRLLKRWLLWQQKHWMVRPPAKWAGFKRQEMKAFRQNMKRVLTQEKLQLAEEFLELGYRQMELSAQDEKREGLELMDRELAKRFHALLTEIEDPYTDNKNTKGEKWATTLSWFIPRKYRHVIGDILEDCAEMREAGCTERRIKFHVLYQWLIAVITLVPTAVKASIIDTVKQVISPPK